VVLFRPALACLDSCHFDYETIRSGQLGKLEPADARLNTWILAWVQRSLLHDPASLYDANIFYPARRVLTQSEHLLAQAVTLLPVRALGAGPVGAHQAGAILSALLLGLTTFGLLRGVGASAFAACAAGAAALAMPWRLAEVSHLQLLSAQWFPLVWWLTLRVAGEGRRRRDVVGLALALALQLLSSFYLAYYLAASFVLLVAALWLCGAVARGGFAALGAALAVPAALLVLVALPYVQWSAQVGFLGPRPIESVAPADVLALVAPRFELGWRGRLPLPVSFELPLALCALAAAGAFAAWRAPKDATGARLRGLALGLALLIAAAFVLALGRELAVGDAHLPLPGALLARWVPGYDNLRNPLRWAIPIGIAVPVLAGLGIAWLERLAARPAARAALRAGVVLLWLVSVPWVVLPVRDAWEDQHVRMDGYRALDALGPGAMLELPWPLDPTYNVQVVSRYVQASTLHWRPLVNGISGYVPPSHLLLRQVVQELPGPGALARLHALCAVRFVLLHMEAMAPLEREAWKRAVRSGRVQLAWSDDATWIVELIGYQQAGALQAALVSPAPRERTLTGLSRAPLPQGGASGALVLRGPADWFAANGNGVVDRAALTLRNASDVAWPGLDVQPEGLVRVRYAFVDADGRTVRTDTMPIADDVAPRRALTLGLPVIPPGRAGRYRLRAELVQVQGGEERLLPVTPAELATEVHEIELGGAPPPASPPPAR
jgi:hypothetical protein